MRLEQKITTLVDTEITHLRGARRLTNFAYGKHVSLEYIVDRVRTVTGRPRSVITPLVIAALESHPKVQIDDREYTPARLRYRVMP